MIALSNLPISRFVVETGRVNLWRQHPEKGTLNVSCFTKVAEPVNNLWEDMHCTSVALRGAAGENLVVNPFVRQAGIKTDWSFYLQPDHPDFDSIYWEQFPLFGVGCGRTIIRVNDSMTEDREGKVSIESSWKIFYEALLKKQAIAVDLSDLRPAKTTNKHGLEASGPLSFLKIYQAIAHFVEKGTITAYLQVFSTLNEVLRRGGVYKNGAVATSLDWDHPDALEYINLPLANIPYLKKGFRVYPEILKDEELTDVVLSSINAGSLWLEKDFGTHEGEQLWPNTCRGIGLKDGSTCLIAQGNSGQIENPEDWLLVWRDPMQSICSVFEVGAARSAGIYRDPQTDRQVAVGIIGLANCLAYHNISYQEWVEAFERFLDGKPRKNRELVDEMIWYNASGVADAADIARSHGMRAAFSIEPTASCAYRYQDLKGYTCCPNVDPPVAIPGVGTVRRNSEAVGDQIYHHGPVETAEEVGADLHYRHRVCWQRLFNSTGLAHAQSYEIWDNWTLEDFKQWFDGPLLTSYYKRNITTNHLEKGRKIMTAKSFEKSCNVDNPYCEACGD